MRTRHVLGTGLAALTLLALAACTTSPGGAGSTDGDSDTDGGSTGAGGGTTAECLQGSWELDGQRQLEQLQENFNATGMNTTATLVEGGVTLTVDGDTMTYDSNITYTMTAELSNGLQMQVVQTQFGVSEGRWSEAGDQVVFRDWTNGIQIENTISVAGETTDMPITLPADTGTGVGMSVTCSGAALQTKAAESPFTNYWERHTP